MCFCSVKPTGWLVEKRIRRTWPGFSFGVGSKALGLGTCLGLRTMTRSIYPNAMCVCISSFICSWQIAAYSKHLEMKSWWLFKGNCTKITHQMLIFSFVVFLNWKKIEGIAFNLFKTSWGRQSVCNVNNQFLTFSATLSLKNQFYAAALNGNMTKFLKCAANLLSIFFARWSSLLMILG